ncbi:hypothetical protein F1880_008660 [Penicillium rolfsii]|nr:hypothetical protein F1880_008660 [Penicillium rolfsii]
MNPAARALRPPLRLPRHHPWTRPPTQPTLCARVAHLPLRFRQYQPPHSFSTAFSTHAVRLGKAKSENSPDDDAWKPFAMTFESARVRENVKKMIIGLAVVTATLELFVWCESIWTWWKGKEGDKLD